MATTKNTWPILQFDELKDTLFLLHHWAQIIGKVRLKKSPWQNHSWHVALYVDSQGLTTGLVPFENGAFEIRMDFIHHEIRIKTSGGSQDRFPLGGQTVASFYELLMEKLKFLGIQVKINGKPNEMSDALPFGLNKKKVMYQANSAQKIWKALIHVHKEFSAFQSKFTGKSSPIQLFWGSFDLAYTRFSGKRAPAFEADVPNIPKAVMLEAYSHEVFSVGFWLGTEAFPTPSVYAYCYPNYPAFKSHSIQPKEANWNEELGEFLMSYEVIQKSISPEITLQAFLQSTYEAAAKVGNWDRESLDGDFSHLEK